MTFLTSRRSLLGGSAAFLGLFATPALAKVAAKKGGKRPLRAALDSVANQVLRLQPENATSLGIDSGARAALRAQFSDGSAAGNARFAAAMASAKTRLAALDGRSLTGPEKLQRDTAAYAIDRAIEAKAFSYATPQQGFFGGTTPYPVSQQNGAVSGTPEFLDSIHPIDNAADAEAYLSRVAGFAKQLDDETAAIKANAARGVIPPEFVCKTVIGQLGGYRKTAINEQKLVTSIATRTKDKGIAGPWGERAAVLAAGLVYPALDRQITAFTEAAAKAPAGAGVQRLPDGDAYYAWALKLGTTTNQSPAEIHRIGRAQNEELKAQMAALLDKAGITGGTVGERLQALNKRPDQLFSDDAKGREQLIAYCNAKVIAARTIMPKASHMKLKADVIVKRVPEDIQDGAALGYMNFASLDGSRPAIYYINLKSTSLWPKYQIATLTAHEGVPGHTWQGAYLAERSAEIPLISSLIGFNAFVEGWALYSEQLCDEFGLYADDPFSKIGMLQALQFRACRLVADTGLHNLRWTRDETVSFLMTETGRGQGAMTSETDRYCVAPGQACGYKTGHNEILRLRADAKATLGDKFDIAGFNDTLVKTGGVPLSLLPGAVSAWVKGIA
jgi:uncharacterized protein (DUF885 family)